MLLAVAARAASSAESATSVPASAGPLSSSWTNGLGERAPVASVDGGEQRRRSREIVSLDGWAWMVTAAPAQRVGLPEQRARIVARTASRIATSRNPLWSTCGMQAVRDRELNDDEFERLRLLLSTFRDGSGQYLSKLKMYMPDYLAFERATAFVCRGETTENKGIFDVLVPSQKKSELPFGISCKMATAQPKDRSWFMEMSNSAKKFHDAFDAAGVVWTRNPALAGQVLVDLVASWHENVRAAVDVARSKYLLLVHDKQWKKFRIVCLDLDLRRADPATDVRWVAEGKGVKKSSIAGYIDIGGGKERRLWQFYANSGGQLKYYPPVEWAEWTTELFELEEPSVRGPRDKVDEYWPGLWPESDD